MILAGKTGAQAGREIYLEDSGQMVRSERLWTDVRNVDH